jgi:hypothetical protein
MKDRMFSFITKTWNPVAMFCQYQCYNGGCWAELLKKGRLKDARRYRNLMSLIEASKKMGDNSCYAMLMTSELSKRFKAGDYVFVEDMGDLFGEWVRKEWIDEVLNTLSQGHVVYPMEMDNVGSDYQALYGLVDVVSMFHNKLWAWEYKSCGDSVKRAVLQVENYRRSFDYVSVVVEDLGKLDSLIKKKGLLIFTLLKQLGAGIYWCKGEKFDVVMLPIEQIPEKSLHDDLVNRFRRNVLSKPIPQKNQTSLLAFNKQRKITK